MSKEAPEEQEETAEEESTEEDVQVEEEQMEEKEETEEPKEPELPEAAVEEEVPAPEVEEEPAAPEAEETAEEEAEEGEEEIEVVEERFYTIPFRKAWITPRHKRAPRSMRILRSFISRHMKAEEVSISNEVNEFIWSRSIKKPPRKIRVRAVKDKEGRVIVYPAEAAS